MNKRHIEIYYDHYKDTFEKIIIEKNKRQKYFFIMLLNILLIFLTLYIPNIINTILNDILKNKISTNIILGSNWIKSILLFSFIWISFSYYQATLNIERLYFYIHKLEDKLSNRMGSLEISREGKYYLENYPKLLTFIHIIYNLIIPLFIIVVIIFLWYQDNSLKIKLWKINNIIDTIFDLIIISTTFLFFIRMNVVGILKKN